MWKFNLTSTDTVSMRLRREEWLLNTLSAFPTCVSNVQIIPIIPPFESYVRYSLVVQMYSFLVLSIFAECFFRLFLAATQRKARVCICIKVCVCVPTHTKRKLSASRISTYAGITRKNQVPSFRQVLFAFRISYIALKAKLTSETK